MRHGPCVAVAVGIVWLARAASAHDLGLSQSTFTLDRNTVRAHIVLAAPDVGDLLDADGDGRVTLGEADAGRPRLGALVLHDTEVTVGGARCTGSLDGVSVEGADGIALDATFACPRAQGELAVVLNWLGTRPPAHRHVMHLVAGERTMSALLTAERQGTAVALAGPQAPAAAKASGPAGSWAWWIGALALTALALFVLRTRRGPPMRRAPGRDGDLPRPPQGR